MDDHGCEGGFEIGAVRDREDGEQRLESRHEMTWIVAEQGM